MSQITRVMDIDMPSLFTRLAKAFDFVNLDVGVLINYSCLEYHLLPKVRGSTYYFFWQAVCMPWVIVLLIAALGAGVQRRYPKTDASALWGGCASTVLFVWML